MIYRFESKDTYNDWFEFRDDTSYFEQRSKDFPGWNISNFDNIEQVRNWFLTSLQYWSEVTPKYDEPCTIPSSSTKPKCRCEWRDVYMKGCGCGGN